jgi:hypothetical protein
MAKGKNDLILRDRLQFTLDSSGDLPVVYGRIDLSDYTSVVNNEGLSIKEMRIQVRNPQNQNTGTFNPDLVGNSAAAGVYLASMTIYGTTTAYESAVDVGIGSPNTFFQGEYVTFSGKETGASAPSFTNVDYIQYGTPDLHPSGYVVVSDVLVGIATNQALTYADETLELDIMLIAEPVKVTKDELKEMLAQATDL